MDDGVVRRLCSNIQVLQQHLACHALRLTVFLAPHTQALRVGRLHLPAERTSGELYFEAVERRSAQLQVLLAADQELLVLALAHMQGVALSFRTCAHVLLSCEVLANMLDIQQPFEPQVSRSQHGCCFAQE